MDEALQVYRNEDKFIILRVHMSQLKAKLDVIMKKDDNSSNGSYTVRSLYFDSINNIYFNTKLAGTKVRKK